MTAMGLVSIASQEARAAAAIQRHRLTERQLQVIALVASDRTNKEIAREMGCSEATIKVHIRALHRMLGLHTRTGLAMWAVRNGLVEP